MTANHGDFSPEARDRAERTAVAAGVYAGAADAIAAALAEVGEAHVLVVVVGPDHHLGAMHRVATADLLVRVPELEADGSWAMVFSPGSSAEDVRRRGARMAEIAGQRVAAIDRIRARRADRGV